MTYNVNFALAHDRETRDAIGSTDADVVLLQETNDAWAGVIRARHAGRYPHMRFAAPGRMLAGGLGVISRWPFEVTDVSPSDGGLLHRLARAGAHARGVTCRCSTCTCGRR
jgi:hypothetical protein